MQKIREANEYWDSSVTYRHRDGQTDLNWQDPLAESVVQKLNISKTKHDFSMKYFLNCVSNAMFTEAIIFSGGNL